MFKKLTIEETKPTKYTPPIGTCIFEFNEKVSPSIVNSIRKSIMSIVPSWGFDRKNIYILKNTSIYTNDMISIRLKHIPIPHVPDNINKISLYIKAYNDTSQNINVMSVNAPNITVKFTMNDKEVDINNGYEPFLIIDLKPKQAFEAMLTASVNIGIYDTLFSPAATCHATYTNEDKYKLTVPTKGQLSTLQILNKIMDNNISMCDTLINNLNINEANKEHIELSLTGDYIYIGHWLAYILNRQGKCSFAGAYMPTLLVNNIVIKYIPIEADASKQVIIDAVTELIDICKKMKT